MTETYSTHDYHTGGEPFRIVTGGAPALPGGTVANRRMRAIADPAVQRVRQILCHEPRGHADMYGAFVTEPDDAGAHLGALFWHKDGFSTACGHGTIALGVWAVETGRVPANPDGRTEVAIDVPSGRVTASVSCEAGRPVSVDFRNVASWVSERRVPVSTSRGNVEVDVSFGGALYASLRASEVGLSVTAEHYQELIALGREIKHALNETVHARHPSDDRLSGIYGTIFYDELDPASLDPAYLDPVSLDADLPDTSAHPSVYQRNVTVFADGEIDRSPCGSGTGARMALLAADGSLTADNLLVHDSIVGSRFIGRILESLEVEGRSAIFPGVTGMAYRTGTAIFEVDQRDPITPGFVVR